MSIFDLARVFEQPTGEGWSVFNIPTAPTDVADFLACGIERHDEEMVFADDVEAQAFVQRRADEGSVAHQQAISLHELCDDVRRTLWGPDWVDSRCGPSNRNCQVT